MPPAKKGSVPAGSPKEATRRAEVWREIAAALKRGPRNLEDAARAYEEMASEAGASEQQEVYRRRRLRALLANPVEAALSLLAFWMLCRLTMGIASVQVETANLPGSWIAEFFPSEDLSAIPSRTRTWRGVLWTSDEPVLLRRSAIVQPEQIPLLQRQSVWMHAYTCLKVRSPLRIEIEILSQRPSKLYVEDELAIQTPGGQDPFAATLALEAGVHLVRIESSSSLGDNLLMVRAGFDGQPLELDFSQYLAPPRKPPGRLPLDWRNVCDLERDADATS